MIRPPPKSTLFPLHDALPIFMRLRMFLLLITFLKASHSFRNRLQEGDKQDRKSGSAGMPRPISYAVFCLKKKKRTSCLVAVAMLDFQQTGCIASEFAWNGTNR